MTQQSTHPPLYTALRATEFISAAEAARRLGVKRQTLYAYVARGLLHSYDGPGRTRRYAAAEVERLRAERDYRQAPLRAATDALQWGPPLLRSAITTVDDGQIRYRGHNLDNLVGDVTFEGCCALLWPCDRFPDVALADARLLVPADSPIRRFQMMLVSLSAESDPAPTPQQAAREGARLLQAGATALGGTGTGRIAERLAEGWQADLDLAPDLIDAALVAVADHELTAATLAARCAASTGSGLAGAVLSGVTTLVGRRYGTALIDARALLDEAGRADRLWDVLSQRMRAGHDVPGRTHGLYPGQPTPGFGHPLYPEGDPRARLLLGVLEHLAPEREGTAFLRVAMHAGPSVAGAPPGVDLALAALSHAAGLPPEASLWLFSLARSAGFVAHAAEQMASGALIRPRAYDSAGGSVA